MNHKLNLQNKLPIGEVSIIKLLINYLSVSVIFIALQVYVLSTFGIGFMQALVDASLSHFLILFAGLVTFNVLRYYKPIRENSFYPRVWAMLLSLIITLIFKAIVAFIYPNDLDYLSFVEKSQVLRGIYILLNIALLTVFIFLWFYFSDEQKKQQQLADVKTLTRDAELVSLRQQLQPHFLFNSLNSISALVVTRPQEARKMIQQLSDFLRGTLRKDELELISLNDELAHLQLYLDIEKVRFGHRLSTDISTESDFLNCKIPPLILQPLVENAIKFGLYDVTGDVTISIICQCNQNNLTINITNPFDATTSSPQKGVGFGLSSVQRRLYLLYARNDLISTTHQNNLFTTTVIIPQLV
jgi:two-component system LytT family sensor kinase